LCDEHSVAQRNSIFLTFCAVQDFRHKKEYTYSLNAERTLTELVKKI